MRLTLFLGALGVPLLLAACKEMPVMPFNVARQAYPPDRAAWETISTSARAAHARSVHMALMTRVPDPVTWSAEGVSGTVTVLLTKEGSDTVCRGFSDRIEAGGHATEVTDIGCWADGWMYARQGGGVAVLEPAFAESDRVYTVKWGGSLAAVAKRTGVDIAELERLNPGFPANLPAGTRVLLP